MLPAEDPRITIGIRDTAATYSEMQHAFEALSQKWDPAQNLSCDEACDEKWAEIREAWFHIKKDKAPQDITWVEWAKDISAQWMVIFKVIAEETAKEAF